MAAHNAVINVSASILPEWCKIGISGNGVHNLNDIGTVNRWISCLNSVSDGAQQAIPDGTAIIPDNAGDTADTLDGDVDDLGIIFIKHTGYQGDGVTKTALNTKLYINTAAGVDANQGAAGDMYLLPGELWWGRFAHIDIADISLEASTGTTINAQIYAIVDMSGDGI